MASLCCEWGRCRRPAGPRGAAPSNETSLDDPRAHAHALPCGGRGRHSVHRGAPCSADPPTSSRSILSAEQYHKQLLHDFLNY